MLSFRKAQSTLLAKQLADTGNLVAAAFVIGPFISARPFSVAAWFVGVCIWLGLVVGALFIAGKEGQ
ncbi:MAG TPA: hypothetical protein VJM31_02690 [Vicinamibacterales bacterium]|nr:hypothetical protein [Vicinamibacterales bacterium]